uniref:Homeobox domain-containing protein n=1 Tax=Globodera rostochiensis TaxID=31243 RepID=A0A914HX75_GLORO
MGEKSTTPSQQFATSVGFQTFLPVQIDFICQCLCQWDDGARLVHLFAHNHRLLLCPPISSTVLKAYLFALFHDGQFDELFRVMMESEFERSHHKDLVKLWYSAHYEEERQRKHKELVPVDKYRIRKKYPPPKSVWDGDELVYSFRKGDRRVLREYYERNKYPSSEAKHEISRRTGLSMIQIANWFKNRRQREKSGI